MTYQYKLRPEADPAVLLAWIENDLDLANIHRAARVRRSLYVIFLLYEALQSSDKYSITVSQEFANEFWKKELTQVTNDILWFGLIITRCQF